VGQAAAYGCFLWGGAGKAGLGRQFSRRRKLQYGAKRYIYKPGSVAPELCNWPAGLLTDVTVSQPEWAPWIALCVAPLVRGAEDHMAGPDRWCAW